MRMPLAMAIFLALWAVLPASAQTWAFGETTVRLALPKQLVVEKLPNFSAKDRDGELFQRRHLEKLIEQTPGTRRVALVYFATWCGPCAAGAMELRIARAALKKNGVLTIFVNVGEKDTVSVNKWIKSYGDPGFPLILDARQQLVDPYGLAESSGQVVMPKTLVLNEKLKPLFLLGAEGNDFPEILWKP